MSEMARRIAGDMEFDELCMKRSLPTGGCENGCKL